jgi:hypothetical protein
VFYRLCGCRAYTRLEPDDGKPSSPVLRGGSGSNAVPLPDPTTKCSVYRSSRLSEVIPDSVALSNRQFVRLQWLDR